MATGLRIVLVTCLLVFNYVLAKGGGGGKYKKLEARVKTLEGENECKTCSFIDQLKERLNKMEEEIAELKNPPTTLPPPTPAPTLPPAPECHNYQALTDGNRKITNGASRGCDSSLGPGWFRFHGAAGTKMPTSCTPAMKCGTHATGWLNGAHPAVAEGRVIRKACFSWPGNCCTWSIYIQVRNCGDFFIYYINGTPREHTCNLAYCGTD